MGSECFVGTELHFCKMKKIIVAMEGSDDCPATWVCLSRMFKNGYSGKFYVMGSLDDSVG